MAEIANTLAPFFKVILQVIIEMLRQPHTAEEAKYDDEDRRVRDHIRDSVRSRGL